MPCSSGARKSWQSKLTAGIRREPCSVAVALEEVATRSSLRGSDENHALPYPEGCAEASRDEPLKGGSLFAHASSSCLRDLRVSKSSRICCSVADISSYFLFLVSLAMAKLLNWESRCFARRFVSCLRRRHAPWSRDASCRAPSMSGWSSCSTMLCNIQACQCIPSSSILCSNASLGGVVLNGASKI